MYVCMYVRMYVCTYVRIYVCMYVGMYVCTHVRMYVCMHVCMYVCMHACMYVVTALTIVAQLRHAFADNTFSYSDFFFTIRIRLVLKERRMKMCLYAAISEGSVRSRNR